MSQASGWDGIENSTRGSGDLRAPAPGTPVNLGHKKDVLLISPREIDWAFLAHLLAGTQWNPLRVRTSEAALIAIARLSIPVVVCGLGENFGECKRAVRAVTSSEHPAPVLVLAPVHDWRLWETIIDSGGFDLLAKTFSRGQAVELLDFAFGYWTRGLVRRIWDALPR